MGLPDQKPPITYLKVKVFIYHEYILKEKNTSSLKKKP
jgi:hypothetical protein